MLHGAAVLQVVYKSSLQLPSHRTAVRAARQRVAGFGTCPGLREYGQNFLVLERCLTILCTIPQRHPESTKGGPPLTHQSVVVSVWALLHLQVLAGGLEPASKSMSWEAQASTPFLPSLPSCLPAFCLPAFLASAFFPCSLPSSSALPPFLFCPASLPLPPFLSSLPLPPFPSTLLFPLPLLAPLLPGFLYPFLPSFFPSSFLLLLSLPPSFSSSALFLHSFSFPLPPFLDINTPVSETLQNDIAKPQKR